MHLHTSYHSIHVRVRFTRIFRPKNLSPKNVSEAKGGRASEPDRMHDEVLFSEELLKIIRKQQEGERASECADRRARERANET